MAVKAPAEQPPPAPVYTWTGCYVGGNGGAAWTNLKFHQNGTVGGAPVSADYGSQNDTSPIIGVQVGCDYQAGPWVFGGRGQTEFTDLNHNNTITAFPALYMTAGMRNVTTATGRLGYTVAPQLLLYAQGGGAWVHDDFNVYPFTPFGSPVEGASSIRDGWVAGGGVEWLYSPNWSVFVEYNYIDFGTTNVTFHAAPGTVGAPGIIGIKQTVQTAMAGVNWHIFNWGARY
jgi:outer membrane immunogenic protein